VREELLRTTLELVRACRAWSRIRSWAAGWRWLTIKIGLCVGARFSRWPCAHLYAGTPAVYVNYLDYDVAATPSVPGAVRRSCRCVAWTAPSTSFGRMRRVPEHQYDLYILADHGQAP